MISLTSRMLLMKDFAVIIFIVFKTTPASDVCLASGFVRTFFHESRLFQNVKPNIQGIKEMTTSTRLECATQCDRLSDCRSIFYSTTDNNCLLYGEDVFRSTFENYSRMRRFDVENDVPADCYDVVKKGIQTDGIYLVQPRDGGKPISVCCEISNRGWLRRTDGSEDFYRTWNEYRDGFGNLRNEFWLGMFKPDYLYESLAGNTNIHRLTTQGLYELRVDLEDFAGYSAYASYKNFSIAGEEKNFQLSIANYSGTASNGLSYHNGCYFNTKDKDLDRSELNCAMFLQGAWWYNCCASSNLNGIYGDVTTADKTLVWWNPRSKRGHQPLKRAVMKIRRSMIVP